MLTTERFLATKGEPFQLSASPNHWTRPFKPTSHSDHHAHVEASHR